MPNIFLRDLTFYITFNNNLFLFSKYWPNHCPTSCHPSHLFPRTRLIRWVLIHQCQLANNNDINNINHEGENNGILWVSNDALPHQPCIIFWPPFSRASSMTLFSPFRTSLHQDLIFTSSNSNSLSSALPVLFLSLLNAN